MKKILSLLVLLLLCGSCTSENDRAITGQSIKPKVGTRLKQLNLEGFINDLCYRLNVRREMIGLRCYANVSLEDIIVYLYPDISSGMTSVDSNNVGVWQHELQNLVQTTLLEWDDFTWARHYKITIVDRTAK